MIRRDNRMADYSNISELAWLQYSKKRADYGDLIERDEAALFAQCIELQVLKAPATAVFPGFDEMVINGSNGRYSVSGFVDSQNSYGATIRGNYTYNVSKNINGVWKCDDQFVDKSTQVVKEINEQVNADAVSNTILYWLLGIIGTIITMAFTSCQFKDLF